MNAPVNLQVIIGGLPNPVTGQLTAADIGRLIYVNGYSVSKSPPGLRAVFIGFDGDGKIIVGPPCDETRLSISDQNTGSDLLEMARHLGRLEGVIESMERRLSRIEKEGGRQ